MKHKYKVGDRVVYQPDGRSGNPDLSGWAGKIIGIDGSVLPYTVEFDDAYVDAMDDLRFGGKKGHCWHCAEHHLVLEEENPTHTSRLEGFEPFKKKGETDMNETVVWTKEMDEKMAAMKAQNKTAAEIGAALGISVSSVYCRTKTLKRRETKEGSGRPKPQTNTGELNDLEKVMSETITELKTENDSLRGDIKSLEDRNSELKVENLHYKEEYTAISEALKATKEELSDTLTALAQTEEQLEEALQSLREADSKLKDANQLSLDEYTKTIKDFSDKLKLRDNKIRSLQGELAQVYRTALRLADRCLLPSYGERECDEEMPII